MAMKIDWIYWKNALAGGSGKLTAYLGLLLILGSILYLLAGCLVALDAISFQERVLRIVGDNNHDRARAILNKLSALDGETPEDRPADAGRLPIEALALQLDRVKLATSDLAGFDDAIQFPAPQNTDEGENERSKPTVEELLKGMGKDLQAEIKALDEEIVANIPGINVVRSLERIEQANQALQDEDMLAVLDQAATDQPEQTLRFVEFQEAIETVDRHFQRLGKEVGADAAGPDAASIEYAKALEKVKELRQLSGPTTAEIRDNRTRIHELITELTAAGKALRARLEIPRAKAMQQTFDDLDNAIISVTNLIENATPQVEPKQAEQEGDNQEPEEQIAALIGQTDKLSSFIDTTVPDIATVRLITPALAKMISVANTLSSLAINTQEISSVVDGKTIIGLEAAGLYRQQVETLANAVAAMTSALAKLSDLGQIAQLMADDPRANAKAGMLLTDYKNFGRYQFPPRLAGWSLIEPKSLAVASRESLDIMLVLIVGAIGSMIYMTQRMLRIAIQGHPVNPKEQRPLSWYVARPIFGAVVAFAMYLLYKTGQVALGSGSFAEALQSGINIPILTVIGLFAGLLSWQALDMIQSKGEAWLESGARKNMWATGLVRALDAKNESAESCAQHVARSINQIDRWVSYRDSVTPEMQDRLTTWLDMSRNEIFSSMRPTTTRREQPMYAVGLEPYLQRQGASENVKSIALALRVPEETVERWRDQKQPVSSEYQWSLVGLLDCRYLELFEPRARNGQNWAVQLRQSMVQPAPDSAAALAAALNVDPDLVRDWRDLYRPVPAKTVEQIADVVGGDPNTLFDAQFDRLSAQQFAKPQFQQAIAEKYGPVVAGGADAPTKAVEQFAQEMDVRPDCVVDWLKGAKPVFPPTSAAAANKLGKPAESLFKNAA